MCYGLRVNNLCDTGTWEIRSVASYRQINLSYKSSSDECDQNVIKSYRCVQLQAVAEREADATGHPVTRAFNVNVSVSISVNVNVNVNVNSDVNVNVNVNVNGDVNVALLFY